MIKPSRPCKPGCPGWRVVRAFGLINLVRTCERCWAGSVLKPSYRYYQRQPECREALKAANVNR